MKIRSIGNKNLPSIELFNHMTEINTFEKHAKLTVTLLLVFGIVLSDFVLANIYKAVTGQSFYTRIVNPGGAIEKKYRIPSDLYHHDLKKNVSEPAMWGPIAYRMITNSLGFRDKEIRTIAKKPDKYRIVFMGDSFVEGSGIRYEDTFVGLLDNDYADRLELLNAGVGSYAPTAYYRKSRYLLEQYGLNFNEMVVFIDISDIEDETRTYANYPETVSEVDPLPTLLPSESKGSRIRAFFKENSILYGIPRIIKAKKKISRSTAPPVYDNAIINYRRALWTVDKEQYVKYGEVGLKKAKANILNLKRLLDKHHIKLSLVVYPWPTQIFYNDLESIQVREWQKLCADNGIKFINLFPYFVTDNPSINKQTISDYYINDDMHWNQNGHKKVAEILRKELESFQAANKIQL